MISPINVMIIHISIKTTPTQPKEAYAIHEYVLLILDLFSNFFSIHISLHFNNKITLYKFQQAITAIIIGENNNPPLLAENGRANKRDINGINDRYILDILDRDDKRYFKYFIVIVETYLIYQFQYIALLD